MKQFTQSIFVHDKDTARRFLAGLDPNATKFTFRFFSDSSKDNGEIFHGTLDEVWPRVQVLNTLRRGIGVFVTINETDFKGGSGKNIVRARALFVDADSDEQSERCVEVFTAFKTIPSMAIKSGRGCHFYFCTDVPVDQFSSLQKNLADKLGTDAAVIDPPRVMRLPGTLHLKNPKTPRPVKLLNSSNRPIRRWQLGDLISKLGLHAARNATAGAHSCENTPLDPRPVFKNCPHFRYAFDTGGNDASQGLWMLDVLATTFFVNGRVFAHALSDKYPTYSREETDKMYDRKLADRAALTLGWPGCEAFENAGSKQCASCPLRGKIKSPLNLAVPINPLQSNSGGVTQSSNAQQPVWCAADLKTSFSHIPHRKWLYGTYLIRGEVTIEAAPGAAGKTAHATGLAVEIATGIELLDEKIFKAGDLTVLYINGEDTGIEMERRVWAFCRAHANKIPVQGPDRLFVAGTDNAMVQRMSFLSTTDGKNSMLDANGFAVLEAALQEFHPDLLVLDPLVAFCAGGNMNDNVAMAQIIRQLKRLAIKFDCAVLVLHHTRKGGANDGNAEDISGASAIVNLARRAIMPAPMTEKEADQFFVPPSERFRYFKLVDAKSNLAPRLVDSPLYKLHSIELPNFEPPVYPNGDNVQAVQRINLPLLQTATVTTEEQKIRDVIFNLVDRGKIIEGQRYPYSPSDAGSSKERALLEDAIAAVQSATAPRHWPPGDLEAVTKRAIKKMKSEGLLVIKDMKELVSDPGRFRKGRGLAVNPAPVVRARTNDSKDALAAANLDGGQFPVN